MKIRKNDTVLMISGKDRGKKGKVRFAHPDDRALVVEGINIVKKHTKAVRDVRQAGIIEREAQINISNLMLICKRCNKPVRIGFKTLEDGRKVRICRVCKEVIE